MSENNNRCHTNGLSPLIVSSIIESMALGLMVIDPAGKIVVANQALADILGYSVPTMLSKGWGPLFIDNEQNLDFNQVFIDVIWNEQQNLQRTVPYERPDGTIRTVSMTTSYLKAEDSMEGIVLLVEDVTQREELLRRERDMMQDMNELQVERSEGLSKLALSVAHQIRNPMMTIGGFANLMQKTASLPERDVEYLGIIREELGKLEGIVSAVADYAGVGNPQRESLQTGKVLEHALDKLMRRGSETLSGFDPQKVALDYEDCVFEADLEKISRAMVELLANAADATMRGGGDPAKVVLSARQDREYVVLLVTDKGEGIKNEYKPYIYDPFFTTRPDRTGMGLCLAKRIALEHQGALTVESEAGEGARAMIRIPRVDLMQDEPYKA